MDRVCDNVTVEARGLVACWGERRILDGVDLQVCEGEIAVIMGGSGSGKTTLLRQLLGLNRPAAGTVRLFGLDPHAQGPRALHALRGRIGMSFQAGALFNSLTVGENVAVPLREHTRLGPPEIAARVRETLARVELPGIEDMMPAELSGGMLKRAALARAIVLDPPLLFFDEPSAGLDPVVEAEMDDLILDLNAQRGATIVVVTHELESTFRIADKVLLLAEGRIVFCGTIMEMEHSDDPRIRAMLDRRSAAACPDPQTLLADGTRARGAT